MLKILTVISALVLSLSVGIGSVLLISSFWDAEINATLIANSDIQQTDQTDGTVSPVSTADSPGKIRFLEGKRCALCHSTSENARAMRDSQGRPVAPFDLWQASMMANSSRDPYWRAVLSAEIQATPSQQAHLEEVCTRCHAPMATPVPPSPPGKTVAFLHKKNAQAALGLDGVSCTVCHQITDERLGERSSFTGNFQINNQSLLFGPHANPVTMPMQRNVNYTPTLGPHILQSSLCGTCHTVITDSTHPDGSHASSEFHEQNPYLEWRNSQFNNETSPAGPLARSCQDCHMPTTDEGGKPISTMLAHNPGGRDFPFLKPRAPFGRHSFVGANGLMTRILRDNAQELQVTAPRAAFNAALDQIDRFLKQQTAIIKIESADIHDGILDINLLVQNQCGHKLPTAYPSRRVWVRLEVTDSSGVKHFSSGTFNDDGELIDGDGNPLPSERARGPVLPHFTTIKDSAQVQIYEAIMADTKQNATFTLLRGATFLKDNRILPLGWSAEHPDGAATRSYGTDGDPDFAAGTDRIQYEIPVNAKGNLQIEATLFYQVISPRHADELFQFDTPEVKTFQQMYNNADRTPVAIASDSTNLNQ